MTGNDISGFRPRATDLPLALGLLTRLPVPAAAFPTDQRRPAAYAAWAYPLVGLIVALLSALVGWCALGIGLPPAAAAVLVLLAGIASTGALHEDGLADCADGFWGGWTRERRLAIMKDSQIGTYGVIALVVALALRWVAVVALLTAGGYLMALACAAVMSRAAMVVVMYGLPAARPSGLSGNTGRPPKQAMITALLFGILAAILILPATLAPALIAATGVTLVARAKIGGQTGDVLGATQQVTEIAVLLSFLATLP
ncbi:MULTISPECIES: adenosylcobinamide-GDP ribazoletransferase [unclassified Sulfitobacter]|uniref:adenosylcobinamide-GDP ribazoletransferase n=1 Tax=unclassified Sulfitobacter TaxID=196795 RepID=UPI0023E1E0D9|nr:MULTISPECIES: adenosylcobinamide-GDP ribazoletransferase [unclassified Sulfitobacter]